ncbi:ABC transporter substrate-binding protein [Tessaracoccus coleopterorum]|uniref:ABC transporter substrate-binding protein n=1 Tax=Tessaracoccus coleopterorum TaxID=2714950 RepID=UPI0018D3FF9E|nr:extracellular solute-binding protein [Tessaracoccus coleopterorum]
MKRNPRLSLVAAVAALALALTGCAGGGGSAGGDADKEDKTLTIWHYENDDSAMGKAWNRAIEIFEDKHPDATVKVEMQTFEQIQKNAKIVLTGDKVPDVMEYNKGNATAGQLAAQGLITPLTDFADEYGWEEKLPASIATTARYNEQGLMGSGEWFGVPNYGEYVGVYYSKAAFEEMGVAVPTTLDEFEAVLKKFKDAGTTPLATGGSEYPLGQLWYELVLANSERSFVDNYQLFKNDVDFHGPEMTKGTEKLQAWIDSGYIDKDVAALTAEDMGVSFINGTYPMMVSGSWWFGRIATEKKDDWGCSPSRATSCTPGRPATSGSSRKMPTRRRWPPTSSTSRSARGAAGVRRERRPPGRGRRRHHHG